MLAEFSGTLSRPWQTLAHLPQARRWAAWRQQLAQITALADKYRALGEYELRKQSLALRYRAKSGEPGERLLPEAYALVREAADRALGMRHYDVQLLGGMALYHRSIAEMQTGEGKTLTATLPLYLAALAGHGAHLATANDYLACRDAELMRPLFEKLGLTVGVVVDQMQTDERRAAYACDITYGTAHEFGFDFLRDRLLLRRRAEGEADLLGQMLGEETSRRSEQPVQRSLHFMLVDEADSILIDDARTPLVISALPSADQRVAAEAYRWAAVAADQFHEGEHYTYDPAKHTVMLNAAGRQRARTLPKPDAMDAVGLFAIYEFVERAIRVGREMVRDRQYIVRDGEVVIVDEATGRLAEGRKWRAGMHQAIEAKEGLCVTFETHQAARITIQDFFLQYQRLAGMTGTAASSSREMQKIYNLRVVVVPTNRPPVRKCLPERVYGTSAAKWQAIVDEVAEVHATGRPVLIGTRSIDKSMLLAQLLAARGIEHQVLNAHRLSQEAEIIAHAGERGRVTVSTNMAGRGTDIKLGPGVYELGGLHVICSELHESPRIDRQLIGRCGRQGDPGTYRQYMALDDDLLQDAYGERRAARLRKIGTAAHGPLDGYRPLFTRAQQRLETRHFRQRKILLYQEKQRKKLQLPLGQDPYLDAPS